MEVAFDADYVVPNPVFVGQTPTLQTLLDVCGVKGVFGAPERLGPNRARYAIQW